MKIKIIIKDFFAITEIYKYLTRKQKFLIFILLACLLISSFAALIGIASIIPLIEIIKDPLRIENYYIKSYLDFIFNITGIQRVNIAVISSISMVVFAYLARLFSEFFILYSSAEITIFLHNKVLKNYLKLPYNKQIGKITNELPYCLSKGIDQVQSRIIFRWLNAISSLFLFISLSGGLLIAEPQITLLFIILVFSLRYC